MPGRNEQSGRPHARLGKSAIALAAVLAFAALPLMAVAAQMDVGLNEAANIGLMTTDIRTIVAGIINVFLGLLGLVAVCLMMYGGWIYMMSKGEAAEIDRAKKIIINGVIGLMIILSAYGITAFIFRALEDGGLFGGNDGGSAFGTRLPGDPSGLLGSGMIEYHYPENGQRNVPRNTRLSITFKKPLARSTVFCGYYDGGTYDLSDDRYCTDQNNLPTDLKTCPTPVCTGTGDARVCLKEFALNTDTIKIIAQADIGTGNFAATYAKALANPDATASADGIALKAKVTDLPDAIDTTARQTIVIIPVKLIGSGEKDMDYRVKILGGSAGVRIWTRDADGKAVTSPAFSGALPNDPYFWSFTTSTLVDNTPPKLIIEDPSAKDTDPLPRNQVLQMTFDEAVDPTTASGIIGTPNIAGFQIQARCANNSCVLGCDGYATQSACDDNATKCSWNASTKVCHYDILKDQSRSFSTIPGKMRIGNRNQTVEFLPDKPCEGITTNSCGETVYCLPKNVEIRVTAITASIGTMPPASSADDGIMDMAANSFDGNRNGKAEGKSSIEAQYFNLNSPQSPLGSVKDSVRWIYKVGEDIDLVPPTITDLEPKSVGMSGVPSTLTEYDINGIKGPSAVPSDVRVRVTWSKKMMATSALSGAVSEMTSSTDLASVAVDQYFCSKTVTGCPAGAAGCPTSPVATCPVYVGFYPFWPTDVPASSDFAKIMEISHDLFPTVNDLGFSESDCAAGKCATPGILPILGGQLRDSRQNCFAPSGFSGAIGDPAAPTPACSGDAAKPDCCNLSAGKGFVCPAKP